MHFKGPLLLAAIVALVGILSFQTTRPMSAPRRLDAPTILGQQAANVDEDQPYTIELTGLIVDDPGNTYPNNFTLSIVSCDDCALIDGTTVTPAANFNGTLTVMVKVNDGTDDSNTFPFEITVDPVNDAPVITGQQPISVSEDQPYTINFADLIVSDDDLDQVYPTGFTLTVLSGSHYTFSGTTITPELDFNGVLNVNVQVSDGTASSNIYSLNIAVQDDNDPPSITAQKAVTINEDATYTIELADLTVTDPDDTYPTGFSLVIGSGANYTASGTTITPTPNFFGTLTVPLQVNDGQNNSPIFNFVIQVLPVNDTPVITGQQPIAFDEDQAYTIPFSDLLVTDEDNGYPSGFTMTVFPGADYTVSGRTITPEADFFGTLSVDVQINDGTSPSNVFTLQMTVTSVNDVPTIVSQRSVAVDEDTPYTIALSDLTVTDVDNTYPTDFTLTVLAGLHYTVSGTTITPDANFSGTLSVGVQVNDGTSNSATFPFAITVNAIDDPPIITGQKSIVINEDQSYTLQFADLLVTDPDNTYPTGFTLLVSPGANYTVSGNTITPSADFNGTLSVNVQVNDGSANSNIFTITVTVNGLNDAPIITGQGAVAIDEDQSYPVQFSDLLVTDVDNTYPTGFSLTVLSGSNYVVSGTTITPTANFSGTLSVNVRVNDGQTNSNTFALQVAVNSVNDAPTITGQSAITINEDTPYAIKFADLNVTDPDNTYPAGFSIVVSSGVNYTFSGNVITPAANFNGLLNINVQVNDGSSLSSVFVLKITVNPVNDSPVITGQNVLSVNEDQPRTLSLADLLVTDVDNTYPAGFTLKVLAGANYTVSGTQITPAANFNGTLTVSVQVNDGNSDSNTFGLQITVNALNDAPVITGQVALAVNEDETLTLNLNHLLVTDPDNTYPTGFSLIILPPANGANYTVSGNVIKPDPNFFGVLTVNVKVNDGTTDSNTFGVSITVNNVNDAPSFDNIPAQVVMENAGQRSLTITNISRGPKEDAQTITMIVSSGNTILIPTPTLTYTASSKQATLTYTVAPNRSGEALITVTVIDSDPVNPLNYSQSFLITVTDINNQPTLDPISFGPINEDAAVQTITLTGITAGVNEAQDLTVTATTDKPGLFEVLTIEYTSPQSTAALRIKPAANAFGAAQITVRVEDSGAASPSPNVNFISRAFNLTIQSVNDLPVFESVPIIAAVVGESYEYNIVVTDIENDALTLSVLAKPSWLNLTIQSNGRAQLKGIPPASSGGPYNVRIQVKDPSGPPVIQEYVLTVNTRPVIASFSFNINEDAVHTFSAAQFSTAYVDAEGTPLSAIQITRLPARGMLKLAGSAVEPQAVIPANAIGNLTYTPDANYNGADTLYWNATDGVGYALTPVFARIVMQPINDPPEITAIETDSLKYEVGKQVPVLFLQAFNAREVDGDDIMSAEVGFLPQNYRIDNDVLLFDNTSKIKGKFNPDTGVLSLTGQATVDEYVQAIRSIHYNYLNLDQLVLDTRTVYITLSDGKVSSDPKNRSVTLIYIFENLDIPNAFTPNGDQANDVWRITSPLGIEQYNDAEIRIYDKRGNLVFEVMGFDIPWDGTAQGKVLPPDTYYYVIDLKFNRIKYRGAITLLH